jgi:hypothetical protein
MVAVERRGVENHWNIFMKSFEVIFFSNRFLKYFRRKKSAFFNYYNASKLKNID